MTFFKKQRPFIVIFMEIFKIKKHEPFDFSGGSENKAIIPISLTDELSEVMHLQRILSSLAKDNYSRSILDITGLKSISLYAVARNIVRYSIIRRNFNIYWSLKSDLSLKEGFSDLQRYIDIYSSRDTPLCKAFIEASSFAERSELCSVLRNDDVVSLQNLVVSSPGFDFNQLIYLDSGESFLLRRHCIKCMPILPYSILCGSIKCFKYLLLNGSKLDKFVYIPAAAIFGQSIEIVRILEQNGFDFSKSLDSAIISHNEEIFQWIVDKNPNCLNSMNLNLSVQHEFVFAFSQFESIEGQNLFDVSMENESFEFSYYAIEKCSIDPRKAIHDSLKFGTSVAEEFSNKDGFNCNFQSYQDCFIDRILIYQHSDFAKQIIIKFQKDLQFSERTFFLAVKMHDIDLIRLLQSLISLDFQTCSIPMILGLELSEEERLLVFNPEIQDMCVDRIRNGKINDVRFLKYCLSLSNYRVTDFGELLVKIINSWKQSMLEVLLEYFESMPPEIRENLNIGENNLINASLMGSLYSGRPRMLGKEREKAYNEQIYPLIKRIPDIEKNIVKEDDTLIFYCDAFSMIPKDPFFYQYLDPCRVSRHPVLHYMTFPIFEFMFTINTEELDDHYFEHFCEEEKSNTYTFIQLVNKYPDCLRIKINGRNLYLLCEKLLEGFDGFSEFQQFIGRKTGEEIVYETNESENLEMIIQNRSRRHWRY